MSCLFRLILALVCLPSFFAESISENERVGFFGQAMFSMVYGEDDKLRPLIEEIRLGMEMELRPNLSLFSKALIKDSLASGSRNDSDVLYSDILYLNWTQPSGYDVSLGRMVLPGSQETEGLLETNSNFVSNSILHSLHRGVWEGAMVSKTTTSNWTLGLGLHNGTYRVEQRERAASSPWINMGLAGRNTTAIRNSHHHIKDPGYIIHLGRQSEEGTWKWAASWYTGSGDNSLTGPNQYDGALQTRLYNLGLSFDMNPSLRVSAEYMGGSQHNFVRSDISDRAGRFDVPAQFIGTAGVGRMVEDDFRAWFVQAVYNLDPEAAIGIRYGVSEIVRQGRNRNQPLDDGTFDDLADEMTFSLSRKVSDSGTLILEYSTMEYDKNAGKSPAQNNLPQPSKDNFEVIRASFRIDF